MNPDYKTWAQNILNITKKYGSAQKEVEKALEQAFNQGYHLGLNKGWAIEQDKNTANYLKESSDPDIQEDLAYKDF